MAEASNKKYSSFLFTKENGSPIKFRLPPGPEKVKLRPLIEAGGGLLTGKETPNSINLITPTCIAKSANLVCSDYIYDCIKGNKLLDIDKYSVSVGSQFINQPDQNQNSLTMQSRSRSGRNTFYKSEDINIIRFLLEEERLKCVTGVRMWKLMESLKIVNHSWQSTKDHFLKIILPNIRQYSLTPEEVAKFQKIGKPVKGSDGHKHAAKLPLEYVGTGKDVEVEDEETEVEDASQDEDVDDFDQTLVQMAKLSKNAVTDDNEGTVGKRKLTDDADCVEGDDQLVDKQEKKRVKGLKGPKKHQADDGDAERPPSAGQEKNPDSNSPTKAPHSAETSNAPGNADVQKVQNVGEGVRLRTSKRVGLRETTKTQCSEVKKTCTAEIAIADSQNDRIAGEGEEESDFPRQKRSIMIDSSSEFEADVNSEEVFPLVYSGRRYGQKDRDAQTMPVRKSCSSETTSKRNTSPQPCTSKQIPQEVGQKPKKSTEQVGGSLRNFVMTDSLRENTPEVATSSSWAADLNTQSTEQSIEESLVTCDKLISWLHLSPKIFIQAIYQCNGNVDSAIKWLLNESGRIWEPNDDLDIFSGSESQLKVLQEKYTKEFVEERQNYLAENEVFL